MAWLILVPVVPGQHAAVDAVAVDVGAGADASHVELDPAHLHRDDGDVLAEVDRGVVRDVQAEAGLSHARPGADEYQVGLLEPGGDPVEILEPAGDPVDSGRVLGPRDDFPVALVADVLHGDEAAGRVPAGYLDQGALQIVDDALGLPLALVAALDRLLALADRAPEAGHLPDAFGVVPDVARLSACRR